jgi:hypothetical protein
MRLAGTIDKMIMHEDYLVSLLDWKTSSTIKLLGSKVKIGDFDLIDCNYFHYCLQLSTYMYILEEEYACKCKELLIIHLKEDSYEEYEVPYLKDVVKYMVEHRGKR